jgi:hypothetical protein
MPDCRPCRNPGHLHSIVCRARATATQSISMSNGAACPPDPPNVNPAAIKDMVMGATLVRSARTPSIVDDGRIRPTLADDLQGE